MPFSSAYSAVVLQSGGRGIRLVLLAKRSANPNGNCMSPVVDGLLVQALDAEANHLRPPSAPDADDSSVELEPVLRKRHLPRKRARMMARGPTDR
jgi:hypothetical protein